MINLDKLKARAGHVENGLTPIDEKIITYIGGGINEYKKKKKDKDGKAMKDSNGVELREDKLSGYSVTFVEMITGNTVRVVLENKEDVDSINVFDTFIVSGSGYIFRDYANKNGKKELVKVSYFICEDIDISVYSDDEE